MFEVGDKIVCIRNTGTYGNISSVLDLYQTYTVSKVTDIKSKFGYGKLFHSVSLVGIEHMGFNHNNFVHLADFRLKKLLKLKEKICFIEK